MSQPSFESVSPPTVLKQKSAMNIYTVLLIIALASLLLGCIFLWLEISEYGGFGAVKGRIGALTVPGTNPHFSQVFCYESESGLLDCVGLPNSILDV